MVKELDGRRDAVSIVMSEAERGRGAERGRFRIDEQIFKQPSRTRERDTVPSLTSLPDFSLTLSNSKSSELETDTSRAVAKQLPFASLKGYPAFGTYRTRGPIIRAGTSTDPKHLRSCKVVQQAPENDLFEQVSEHRKGRV